MKELSRKVKAASIVLWRRSADPLRAICLCALYAILLAVFWGLGAITESHTDLVSPNPGGATEWILYLFVSTWFGFAYLTILAILFVWLYPHLEYFWGSFRREIAEEETKIIEREERSAEAGSLSLSSENQEVLGRRGRTTHII